MLEKAVLTNANGNVTTMIADLTSDSFWSQTGFAKLIDKPEVTSINGISKNELLVVKEICTDKLGYTERQAMDILHQAVSYKSRTDISSLSAGKFYMNAIAKDLKALPEADFLARYPLLPEVKQKLGNGDAISSFYEGIKDIKSRESTISNVIDYVKTWRTQNGILDTVDLIPV